MIKDVARTLMEAIQDLPFIDKLGGLIEVTPEDSRKMVVSCDYIWSKCEGDEKYLEFVPDSSLKSMFFFENTNGSTLTERVNKSLSQYEADISIVGWINKKKLGYDDCNTESHIQNALIKRIFGEEILNVSDPIKKIRISGIREEPKTPAIFTVYGYKDEFRFNPYEYFKITFRLKYWVDLNCVTDFTPQTEIEC